MRKHSTSAFRSPTLEVANPPWPSFGDQRWAATLRDFGSLATTHFAVKHSETVILLNKNKFWSPIQSCNGFKIEMQQIADCVLCSWGFEASKDFIWIGGHSKKFQLIFLRMSVFVWS